MHCYQIYNVFEGNVYFNDIICTNGFFFQKNRIESKCNAAEEKYEGKKFTNIYATEVKKRSKAFIKILN